MKTFCAVTISCALLIALVTAQVSTIGAGWTLKPTNSTDRVHLTIRRTHNGGTWVNGRDVAVASLRGFSLDMFGRGGPTRFEYVHDAGRFTFEGEFAWGKGSGDYRFEPNPDFGTELIKLGYEAPEQEHLIAMALADVNLIFARNIKSENIGATTKDLVDLRNHGVTFDYIHEARQAGFTDLRSRDFIDLRNHGVKTPFLRDLKAAGYDIEARQIVDLRNHGVNSEYIRELQKLGLRPETRDLIDFKNHGVNPEYLHTVHKQGFSELTARQIIDLRNHGVPVKFIEEVKELGYNFTPRELIDLRNHGVNGEYLRKLHDSGMKNLNASQISKLREHGVE
jgi:hypothetical protein